MKRKKRNIIILTITLLVVAAIAAGWLFHRGVALNKEKERQAEEAARAAENRVLTTVFCASDYQAEPGWPAPSESLTGIVKAVKADGKVPRNVIVCGDYTNEPGLYDYQLSPDESIAEIRQIVQTEFPEVPQDDILFVQGNHDKLTDAISSSGLHEYDDYLVYVLNTESDFPWCQGKTSGSLSKVRESSEELKDCLDRLISNGETRPVFIAGHVPLHFTARTSSRHNTGDNLYSSLIFNTVNEAAKDLDIIYLIGHNPSKGWDCYLGGGSIFKAPGDSVLIPEFDENDVNSDTFTEEILNYTYLNAGYTGYYMNCGLSELKDGSSDQYHAADEILTGTVFEIKPGEIIIYRYSEAGLHQLGSDGEADPYKGGIDAGLIEAKYYSKRTESPQHIERKKKEKPEEL